jgi:Abnormal spindle-like microcephaly-assoc'd, ASPM-SPD-2-Hydin
MGLIRTNTFDICSISVEALQTGRMRLPQSSRSPLFPSILSLIGCTALVVWLSVGAQAASQPLTCTPSHLRFGTVTLGQTESQEVVLTNVGATTLKISAISTGSSEFGVSGLTLPATLAPGQGAVVSVTFSPTATGWTGETLAFTSTASDPRLTLGVEGTGVSSEALTAYPTSLSFGQVAVGSSAKLSVTLTNGRSWKQSLAAFQAAGAGFSVSGPATPAVLAPGENITLTVTFTPRAAGTATGTVLIQSLALVIPLTGTGGGTSSGQLTMAPSSLSFGNVDTGTSSTQSASVTASGGSVTISSAASSNSQFKISGSFPMTLTAGQSAKLNVVFSPTSSGAASGTLTLTTASNSHATESVTGTGVAQQYSVNLSWNASTSSAVAGYNVYRGTTAGVYSKINASLDPSTTYTDGSVASGVTYYYAATTVNSSGAESSYSSPLKVAVP